MKAHISRIIAFSEDGYKNEVKLKDGLNIITGNSKTGKSALLEIVDYCLLNSADCIPAGVVAENSKLYVIILVFKNKKIILGRKPFKDSSLEKGKSKAFCSIENLDFSEEKLTYNYFEAKKYEYRPLKEAKKELLKIFNLNTTTRTEYIGDELKLQSPTVRNIPSFIFQHQNLIASKFALFYRFDNSNKRKSIIKEFPVFTGLVDQDYHTLMTKKDELFKQQKIIEKRLKLESQEKEIRITKITKLRKELAKLLNISSNFFLEDLEKINEQEIKYDEIQKKKIGLENLLDEVDKKKSLLSLNLQKLKDTIILNEKIENKILEKVSMNFHEVHQCPICHSELDELNKEILDLNKEKEQVLNSLTKKNKLSPTIFKQKSELENEIKKFKKQRKKIKSELEICNQTIEVSGKKNLYYYILNKKIELEILEEGVNIVDSKLQVEFDEIKGDIDDINDELNGYDLQKKISEAETTISSFMNKIAKKLEFEKSFGVPNLKFDLDSFDVYQRLYKNQKIYLSSMGSGSNWLTCHLSLFMGLQYYFAIQGVECSIPSILFLDQPSQVYFPDKIEDEIEKNNEDYKNVEDIYIAILYGIDLIEKKTNIRPQIIVMDHADNLDLGEGRKFENYVNGNRWKKNKGEGFIKLEH